MSSSDKPASVATLATLRWAMRVVGVVLIAVTVGVALYARFGGEDVGDGLVVSAGVDHYLVATGSVAHCEAAGERLEIPPLGQREILDGVRIEPDSDKLLTCEGGDVTVTRGSALVLYPVAEYDFVPVIVGAALIVIARFMRPPRRHPKRAER